MKTKTCTWCKKMLPLSAFGNHKLSKDGFNPWCKKCVRIKTKKFRATPSGIYTTLKGLQKFRGRKPVIITREEFIDWHGQQPKKCHYCDISEDDLYLFREEYNSRHHRLTVDCKDNDAGYVLGNIVLACDKCNITKNNILTYEEMLYIGQNFIKPKWMKLKNQRRKSE